MESEQQIALKKMESEQKKRAATLVDMESEAQFAEAEQSATLKKLDSEAQFIDQQTEAERKKAQAERKKMAMTERETARTQRETELGAEQVKFEADISAEVTAATRKEMAEWLARNRLHRHADIITTVAGM